MRKLVTLLLSLTIAVSAMAQEVNVKGSVIDESGNPLGGAMILLKGTGQGNISDADGLYQLKVNVGDTLECSYLGYITQKKAVTGERVDFKLKEDAAMVDDVIVVGYSTVKKADLTGAVSSIKMDKLAELPASNSVMNSLQGRVAGLQIISGGQDPGATSTIIIRGASSINGTQQPLIVLNGFPLGEGADLKQINPADIEDMVVLKDASSTSIYGSRGANGVILVTTKQAKKGERNITFSHQTTISQNTSEYNIWSDAALMAQINNEARINAGQTPLYTGAYDSGTYYPSIAEIMSGNYPTTNWVDVVTQTPIVNNTSFNLKGADERTNYNLGFNYYDERGIYIDNDYSKLSASLDLDYKLFDNFTIQTSTVFSTNNANYVSGGIDRNILFPVYDEDGNYYKSNTSDYANPVALRELQTNKNEGIDFITSAIANWEIFKGFTWKNQINYKYGSTVADQYYPTVYTLAGELDNGRAYIGNWKGNDMLYESYFSYNKTFNDIHNLSVVAGMSYSENTSRSSSIYSSDFANESLGNENLAAGNPENNVVSNGMTVTKLMSYYGKLNYTLNSKYLFTATFRADGSSKFGSDNRWAAFPSGAFAWKLHDESFMQSLDFINVAKVRASYGLSGNQGISAYQTLSRYGIENYYANGEWNTAIGPGYITGYYGADDRFKYWGGIPNTGLKWETTAQLNFGVDVSMFGNRLSVTLDWYDKLTSDLLRQSLLPLSSGYDNIWVNDGEVRNRGIEMTIDYDFIRTKNMYFGGTLIVSKNKNTVESLGNAVQSGLNTDVNTGMLYEFTGVSFNDYSLNGMPNILAVGLPMNTFYGYKVNGIIQSEAEGLAAGLTGDLAQAGEFKYVDICEDGVINDDDRTVIGDPNPDFTASLNLTFNYKNFDASLFVNGSFGGDILNSTAFSSPSAVVNRWTEDNPTNNYPKLNSTRVPLVSDWYIEDGSYVRIQDLNLGYTLNNPFKFISKLRIHATINNVFTFTSFSGYDPEVGMNGIYYGGYPRFRKYSIGANLTF